MALKRLNNEHLIAIEWLAKPNKGGKTYKEIAQLCNVHEQSIYKWRKDPLFERTLKKEMVAQRQDRLPELIESIYDHAIKDGNAAMAKLALQVNDMLSDKVEVDLTTNKAEVDYEALDEELGGFRVEDEE